MSILGGGASGTWDHLVTTKSPNSTQHTFKTVIKEVTVNQKDVKDIIESRK